ncbi:hypothetical protein XENOCAPTIV_012065, partial [Xenoophorus captivus]
VRRGGADGYGRLQQLEVRLVSEVRPPRGETVTPQRVGVQGQLLQGRQGGEEVPREKAQLVVKKKESPEGGQVSDGGDRRQKHFRPITRCSSNLLDCKHLSDVCRCFYTELH